MSTALGFLGDEWFREYDALRSGVAVPPELGDVVSNMIVHRKDGSVYPCCYAGGFLVPGHRDGALSTITLPEPVLFEAIVCGNFKAAFPALFKGKIKVEGNKAALMALAAIPSTATQKSFYEKVRSITRPPA